MTHFRFTPDEQSAINRIGANSGCHGCGVKDPGTLSGNWIGDPLPLSAINWGGGKQHVYPHCLVCKKKQGLYLREMVIRNGRAPFRGVDVFGCMVFVADLACRETPLPEHRVGSLWRTDNCVALGCVSYMDAVATVSFRRSGASDETMFPVFEGNIAAPGRWVGAFDANNDIIAGAPVSTANARIQIWTNRLVEPTTFMISAH